MCPCAHFLTTTLSPTVPSMTPETDDLKFFATEAVKASTRHRALLRPFQWLSAIFGREAPKCFVRLRWTRSSATIY